MPDGFSAADDLCGLSLDRADKLRGDLRDIVMTPIKTLQKPWAQMTEAEQRDLAYSVDQRCRTLISALVMILSAEERKVVLTTVDTCGIDAKGRIISKLVASRTAEHRHDLMDAQGMEVLIVLADPDQHLGADDAPDVHATKDQPELPLDDDAPVFDQTDAGRELDGM